VLRYEEWGSGGLFALGRLAVGGAKPQAERENGSRRWVGDRRELGCGFRDALPFGSRL